MKNTLLLALTLCFLFIPTLSQALITTYDNRATFESAAGTFIIENFEDETAGALSLPATMAGSGLVVDRPSGTVPVSIAVNNTYYPPASPPQNLAFGGPGGSDQGNYTAQFSTGLDMTAFGFDMSGFQPDTFQSGGFSTAFFSSATLLDSIFWSKTGIDNLDILFYGFQTDFAFDTIQLTFTTQIGLADYIGFDSVTFTPVPEPSTFLLLGGGLAGLAFAVRRRRKE